MSKVISAQDVESAAAAGQPQLTIPQEAIVTPAARDRARELGIQLGGAPGGNGYGYGNGRTNGYATGARPTGNGQTTAVGGQWAQPAPPAPPLPPPPPLRSADPRVAPVRLRRTRAAQHEIDMKPNYFDSPAIDNLFTITLELGAALWVVKDRLRVIEELLDRTGVITRQMIEQYQPDPEKRKELIAARDAFIDKIYGILRDNPG